MIFSRPTFHLESNHLLSTCQAGFRFGRSSLDQILTLSQSIRVTSNRIISSPLARLAFALVGRLSTKFLLCLNQSGTASKRKNLQTEPFWHLLTSPRLSTRSGTLLCFINSSRSNSPLALFFGYALSFLIVKLKSRLVVLTAVPSASDQGFPRAWYLVQSSSSCLLMTPARIYLGVPMPPCMLTIWPSVPPPQTRSKHLLFSSPASLS